MKRLAPILVLLLIGCTSTPAPTRSRTNRGSAIMTSSSSEEASVAPSNLMQNYQKYGFAVSYPTDATNTERDGSGSGHIVDIALPSIPVKALHVDSRYSVDSSVEIDVETTESDHGGIIPAVCGNFAKDPAQKTVMLGGRTFVVSTMYVDCAGTETDCAVLHYCAMKGNTRFLIHTRIMYPRYGNYAIDFKKESQIFDRILASFRFTQ